MGIWEGLQGLIGRTLSFFYELIPNFGVAIILLTIVIGIILFPLTLKQTRSMKAMQDIQPEIKKLQRELKHDKQAQQQAMMALYKERGVNPAAGCLPLLLQMPIWFALFSVLRSFASANVDDALRFVTPDSALSSSVRSAIAGDSTLDFMWMDLRIPPSSALSGYTQVINGQEVEVAGSIVGFLPYLIVITLVVFTAYWQQRQIMARNNQQGQTQMPGQAIMKIFPFVFGFISFSLPAGLVVYFAASQLFRIGQQALILGMEDRRKAKDPQPKGPPAEPETKERAVETDTSTPPPSGANPKPKPRPQGSKKRGKKRRRR